MLISVLLQNIVMGPQSATGQVMDTLHAATQAVTTAAATPKEDHISLMSLAMKGWYIMIPMAILSMLTLYFFFERMLTIGKASRLDKNFMNSIRDFIHNGNIDAAKSLCKNTSSPAARMVEKGVNRIGKPIKEIEDAMESTGKLEINKLEKNLSVLSLVGRIAPILGFIGTIAGVIKIFYDISLQDNISIGAVSGGLYQKMFASATGLVVGLIAFIGYYILNSMLDKTIHKMEEASVQFLDLLQEPTK
jgi:biopolymer transport protein ExbB